MKQKTIKSILTLMIIAIIGALGIHLSDRDIEALIDEAVSESSTVSSNKDIASANFITTQRKTHILYGDHTGGGHLYGTGKPCKSEFPANWNGDKIIKEINLIAANDNLKWEQQNNGYHVTESNVNGLKIRVVKGRQNKQVITAYPLNVQRNPCPANNR